MEEYRKLTADDDVRQLSHELRVRFEHDRRGRPVERLFRGRPFPRTSAQAHSRKNADRGHATDSLHFEFIHDDIRNYKDLFPKNLLSRQAPLSMLSTTVSLPSGFPDLQSKQSRLSSAEEVRKRPLPPT